MIDLKEVGVAIGVGAAAGAVAPVVATTWAGAAILGGLSNVAQMLIVNKIENKCTTAKGAAWALGTGLVGGLVGGKFPSGNVFSTTSPYLDKGIASAANNQNIIGQATARGSVARNIGGAIVASSPGVGSDCGCQ